MMLAGIFPATISQKMQPLMCLRLPARLNAHALKLLDLPRSLAALCRNLIESFHLGFGEKQAAVFLRQRGRVRLGLTGEHTLLVPVSENVLDDGLNVVRLVASLGERTAAHRVGMNALEEKHRGVPLVVLHLVMAANGRQRTADERPIQFIN